VIGVLGIIFSWDEEYLFNVCKNMVEKNGRFYKKLTYVEPPQVVSYNSDLTYELGTPLTEQKFLNDLNVITDQPTTITTHLDKELKDVNSVGFYPVTIKASHI
ncbi:hypothetical protein JT83_14590, partial [Listeria monocytogenes]